jgi:tetratricopeptide (TPR) repeat protein
MGDPGSADAFARRGAARLSANEPGQALGDLDEAIRRSPQDAGFFAVRARIQSKLGKKNAALADLDKSLALDPGNREVLMLRAEARLDAKDEKGAFADAEAASRATPPGSLASAEIADLFVRAHQPARAIPLLDEVIAEHREDAAFNWLIYKRCRARALAGVEFDKALNDCNHVMHDRPAVVLDSRGLIYFRKGNFAAAVADYDAALKSNPKLAWSLYMRGQAKIELGQSDAGKADQAAARVIQADIGDEVAGYGIGVASANKP